MTMPRGKANVDETWGQNHLVSHHPPTLLTPEVTKEQGQGVGEGRQESAFFLPPNTCIPRLTSIYCLLVPILEVTRLVGLTLVIQLLLVKT